ncbi:MAG: RIP metalloprotease RseP [Campylobacteraceae bacterium]|jgi:regulator of sigma E protease|nr:RIP metalloprotease RseP [Campylobacteraceae bacterium]
MLNSLSGFVYAFLALSFMVFFHEFGHFIAARIFKVKVEVFSIGFGRKIFKKVWGNTEYCISAIPLGGYVQMKGQNDFDPNGRSSDIDSYNTKAPWKRIIILFAGPFANFFLAFLLYVVIANIGIPSLVPQIGGLLEDSAAKEAGLQINDTIKAINGMEIKVWQDIKKAVNKNSGEIELFFLRDGVLLNTKLTPKILESKNIFGETVQERFIGIQPSNAIFSARYDGLESVNYASEELAKASILIFKILQKLITGDASPKELGGIIAVVDMSGEIAQAGFIVFLSFIALISINLGVVNLLPIPALDGGHIIFNLYEIIFRKAPNEKAFYYLTLAGWTLLILLFAFTVYNDIARILSGK